MRTQAAVRLSGAGTPKGAARRSRSRGRFRLSLLAVVLAGLAIRLAYIWLVRRHTTFGGDPFYYHQGANLLAGGRGFINPFSFYDASQPAVVQAADHPPLYLVYLAAFSVVGITTISGHLLASAALGAGSVALAGLTGREIAGERAGLVAAGLVAVYPDIWRYDGMLVSETPVIFLVLLTVLLAYRYLRGPSLLRLCGVAGAVGFGALARAELVLLVGLLVVPLAVARSARPWRVRLGWAAAGSATTLLVLLPWVAFNLSRFDQTVLLSRNFGSTLAVANCPSVYYGSRIGFWDFGCGVEALRAAHVAPQSSAADHAFLRAGTAYIRGHLPRVPLVVAARLGRITGVYRPVQQAALDRFWNNSEPEVSDWSMRSYYLIAVLAAAGAVLLRRRRQALLPVVAPIASTLLTVAACFADTRFRAAAEPCLCLLAAVAVEAGLRRLTRSRPLAASS